MTGPTRVTRLAAAVVASATVLAACTSPPPGAPPSPAPQRSSDPSPPVSDGAVAPIQGLAISPVGFPATFDALPAFFDDLAAGAADAVVWNGAWRNDAVGGTDAGQIPDGATLVATQGQARGLEPIAIFGWRSDTTLYVSVPGDATNDWGNAEAALLYAQAVSAYAATYHPRYVFLGNENDYYFAQDPNGYAQWIDAYDQAYDAIHAAAPGTLVGPVFQYEHLTGLGRLAAMNEQNWGALSAHHLSKVDVIGLSLYPFFSYATPAEVPGNYLAPIVDLVPNIPLVITEGGWPASIADGFDAPWQASPELQAEYAARLPDLVAGSAGADVRVVSWLYLNAPDLDASGLSGTAWDIFGTVALRDLDGRDFPAYGVWTGLAWATPAEDDASVEEDDPSY